MSKALGAFIGLAFVLVGCGGAQSPGAIPEAGSAHVKSPSKATYSGDLLYVSYPGQNAVLVFTYPSGNLVQTLSLSSTASTLCSDANGNVFIPTSSGIVYEYAHGAKKPKAELRISGSALEERANDCSVDPLTNNLAVIFYPLGVGFYGIAVFPNESGPATLYKDNTGGVWQTIGYDNKSNLFISGGTSTERVAMWELPSGSSRAVPISIPYFYINGQVQWDGKYITLEAVVDYNEIARFTFSSQGLSRPGYIKGTVVGVTEFDNCEYDTVGQSWIQGSMLIVPCESVTRKYGVHGYAYPLGGKPSKHLVHAGKRLIGKGPFEGVTVSVPPSH